MPGSGLSLLVCSSVHPKYFEIDKFDCAIPDDVLQQVMRFLAEEATKSGADLRELAREFVPEMTGGGKSHFWVVGGVWIPLT